MPIRRLGHQLFVLAVLITLSIPSAADSQARIVRLSSVDGDVQVDRNTGQGFESALLNLPVTQGLKLKTGADGRAEIEFEDGSSLRVVPNTVVEFSQLSLRDSGTKATTVKIQEGTAYIDFRRPKDNEFTLVFAGESVRLNEAVRFRLEMNDTDATLAVFSGKLEVEGPSGNVELSKKQSAMFDFANHGQLTFAKNLEKSPFDDWDKEQGKYHDRYLSSNSYSGYGASDLNYYGSYYDVPGYGRMWRPYLAGPGWDPFAYGSWAWYPGLGYTWVSGYPWGWAPFHNGSWVFLQGQGWAWMPGGSWLGWGQFPQLVNVPPRYTLPRSPTTPGRGILTAGTAGQPPVVQGGSRTKVLIRDNSAGLGIPRGGVKNMARISQEARERGSVVTKFRDSTVRMPSMSAGARREPGAGRTTPSANNGNNAGATRGTRGSNGTQPAASNTGSAGSRSSSGANRGSSSSGPSPSSGSHGSSGAPRSSPSYGGGMGSPSHGGGGGSAPRPAPRSTPR